MRLFLKKLLLQLMSNSYDVSKKSKAENEDKPEKNKIINLFTNAAVKTKIIL